MYKILKLNAISTAINEVFNENYELGEAVENPDAILVRSANMLDYSAGDNLAAIGRAGAGVNNIPGNAMAEKGVVVFNTPGANANAVKELVICGMLLASRDIIGGNKWVNTLTENVAKATEKGKGNFGGHEIMGKTLGVIGLGAIGRLVANACVALGMKVIGYDPFLSDAIKSQLNADVKTADFDTVIAQSDIITLHVPLLDTTKNMINADVISKMKDGAVLLNMARGGLVNVADLKAALKSGKIAKYVIDFPDESVLNTDKIIVIPHLGASTEEAEDNCAVMAGNELVDYLENGNITNSVNYPALKKNRTGKVRTCVLFKAEDKAFAEKLGSDAAVAVRGNFGYAIIDGEKAVDAPFALKVRKL
jgi:D-3-phosphoglycerate dehydrogenase